MTSDAIANYSIGELVRANSTEVPEMLPCGYLVGENNIITVNLKGICIVLFICYVSQTIIIPVLLNNVQSCNDYFICSVISGDCTLQHAEF